MTWGNLTAKSSNLLILLPIVLRTFSKEDVVVWYLYFTVVSLQLLIDFGFLPTFSRLFSYAYSGLSIIQIKDIRNNRSADGSINHDSIERIYFATKKVYLWLAIISFLLATTLGSYMVYEPVSRATNPEGAWIGWFIVVSIASFNLYANSLVAFLQGINKVAMVQRWQMLTSFFAVISSACAVYLTKSLYIGIMAYYIWQIINYIINVYLVKREYSFNSSSADFKESRVIVSEIIWPTAWRSGLGVMMSMGLIQLSGMVVAKIETSSQAASYMLALQIIRAISSFSQAPFYSKLPELSALYAKGDLSAVLKRAKQGMRTSFYIFCGMYFIVSLLSGNFLKIIDSKTLFPDILMWSIIGFGFLIERYGAMQIQLYTLSNHIIWHIANGVTGLIMTGLTFVLYGYLGIYSFPIAMFMAYLLFFVPYVSLQTYKEFKLTFLNHERDNFIPILILFSIGILLINILLRLE